MMYKKNWKSFFYLLSALVLCDMGCCKTIPDVNDFFKVGDARNIEVMIPKQGFVGSPPSSRSLPAGIRGIPSSDEDFRFLYIQIEVIEIIETKNGTQIVFRLDETDPNGQQFPEEALYYAHLDVEPSGCKMSCSRTYVPLYVDKIANDKPLTKDERRRRIEKALMLHEMDSLEDNYDTGGIPFPLKFTIPPVLNPHEHFKNNSRIRYDVDEAGKKRLRSGIVYTEAKRLDAPYFMEIHASMFMRTSLIRDKKTESRRYYSEKEKTLDKSSARGSIEVAVTFRETQLWDKSDDWLWLELERTDSDGNVTMRCRKLKKN